MHPQLARAFHLAREGHDHEAVSLIADLANKDHPEALFMMADMYWRGGGIVPRDLFRGRKLFARAAEMEHPRAVPFATNLLASGIAGPRDWTKAVLDLRYEARKDPARKATLDLLDAMALTDEGDPAALPQAEQLSESPHVVRYAGAFSPQECAYLIALAEPNFGPSMVNRGAQVVRDPIRTSDNAVMHWIVEDPAIHALNRRLAAMTGTNVDQGEPLLVLRYAPGQEYRPHYDWTGEPNRRMQTALVYLNEGYGGGETEFCKTGLKVQGRTGDVIVFRNGKPGSSKADPMSEHAGRPVMGGVKYLATRWVRDRRHVP